MFAETANLAVNLTLGGNFTSQMSKARAQLKGLNADSSRAYKAGTQIGTGIKRGAVIAAAGVGVLVSQIGFGLDSLVKLEQAQAQTNAVLKSTKGAAGISAQAITNLSEKYENMNAIVGDEFIRAGSNMLLTFTKIKGQAFEPALQATLNLNTALGKGPEGLTKTAVLVGKALNDPTKGLTALTRVGVAFSKKQIQRIKDLQKEGKTYEAQKIILKELNKEFGGSFLAQGNTTAGSVAKFGDAIEDLQRALATAFLPVVRNVADALTEFLADPEVIQGTKDLSKALASVFTKDNIRTGIGVLGDIVGTIRSAMPSIVSAAQAIGSVVGTAVSLFNTLPTELKTLLVGGFALNKLTGGLVSNIAGGVFGALKAMTVTAGVVYVNGGGGGIPGGGLPGGAAAAGGGGILATAGALIVPVSIAAITIGAAGVLANAIDPTAVGPGKETLGNRDPRRFNSNGQVVRNSVSKVKDDRTYDAVEKLRGTVGRFGSQSAAAARATTAAIHDQDSAPSVSTAVKVNVSVTAGGIKKTVVVQERYGPAGGSRITNGTPTSGGFGGH